MNKNILLKIIWIVPLISFLIILGAYYIKFGSNGISGETIEWGQFGEYLGGTIAPILALLNLIVLSYLTLSITDIETERNKFTLQELARPLADVLTVREFYKFEIILKNCGLGPLKVTNVAISYKGVVYSSFNFFLYINGQIPDGISYWFWHTIPGEDGVIAKDNEAKLLLVKSKIEDPNSKAFFVKMYEDLANIKIVIDYKDIYDRQMPQLKVEYTMLDKFGPV